MGTVLAVSVSLGLGLGSGVAPALAQFGPTRVEVVAAHEYPVSPSLTVVGTIRPYLRSMIASEVEGIVEDLLVREGDLVDAGQVICHLRDSPRRFQYDESQARLRQLEAELAELVAGTRKEELDRTRAAMEEAEAVHRRWELESDRIRRLRERDSASEKEYNDTIWETAAARARLDQAKAVYQEAVAGPREEVIARAQYAVAAQRTAVARLRYDLEQSLIRAPFTGYVVRRQTEIGQWLAAGGAIVEMIELDRVLVRVDVPESAIASSRVGDRIGVDVPALERSFVGQLVHIIPQADERARTFPIEIEVDNPEHELRSGMFVRARVAAGPVVDSIIVPRDAILQRAGTYVVVVVTPGPEDEGWMAAPTPVGLGLDLGDWVVVRSPDIEAGTRVAVKGHDRVYGPMPVLSIEDQRRPPEPKDAPATRPADAEPVAGNEAARSLPEGEQARK